jgi:hypothetical protein
MPDLAVLVPTRGRPGNIRKVISAWDFTNAWDHADLILIVDADDPEIDGYHALQEETRHPDTDEPLIHLTWMDHWMPMVHKLNQTAVRAAEHYQALGFAGDDHLPQTIGWAQRYLTVLGELGSGMVYGDDGYQGKKLSTEWAVTADVVRALGRMVPADVEHMYCDNSIMEMFAAAGALRHLPEVRIEHMHPIVGKAQTDAQYQRVNHRDQFAKDRAAYQSWRTRGMAQDVSTIRDLRKGRPEVTSEPTPARPRVAGSAPRPVARSGPRSARGPRVLRTPRHFRLVRAATPEDVMVALADFAMAVPADQEIVELGVFQGRTALQLAWGAAQGNGAHVTAIDPWDLPGNVYDPPFTDAESRGWAQHWVSSLGYSDKITLVQAFSHEVAARWAISAEEEGRDGQRVGLLYVDGDHTKEGAKRDIVAWAPHLAEGARIAVDDYGHPDWPGVGEAVDELVDEGVLAPIELYHDRLAVTRLKVTTAELIEESPPVTAITSEGVLPSPYPAAAGQVAAQPDEVDVLFDLPAADTEVSSEDKRPRNIVHAGELDQVDGGTPITELNTVQLRALAKHRGIVLGIRKDKRAEILQALKDGR